MDMTLFARKTIYLCGLLLLVFFADGWVFNKAFPENRSIFSPEYEIIDIQANLFSDGTLLEVTGKVKNKSYAAIRGYVIINLKDRNNNNIGWVETDVNKKRPFRHNENGIFEISVDIRNSPTPTNVSVEFVKK